jgi:hypothetical protein
MFDNETGVDILVFVSSALLCIPPAVMIFVQLKLLGRADKDGADSGKITRLYTVFDSVYFCYAFLVVAVAIVVAWSLSDSSYARRYIPPFAVSITLSIVSRRGKKSSKAFINTPARLAYRVFGLQKKISQRTGHHLHCS